MLRLAAGVPRRLIGRGSLPAFANSSALPAGVDSLLASSQHVSAVDEPHRAHQASPEDSAESRPSLTVPAEGVGQPSADGQIQPTPAMHENSQDRDYLLMHPVYTQDYLVTVKPTHKPRETMRDRVGFAAVQVLRWCFDRASGYGPNMSERQWLRRILFLETVAGVPGMVAGMLRHMRSLRSMERDRGWIHTLLEEAENERMHLLTFLQLRHPGIMFRSMVLLGQGGFFNAYMLAYIVWPRACHSFIGYLEEEAVRTYTHALSDIDSGKSAISHWATTPAPDIAVKYWRLEPGSTLRDVVLNVRADEEPQPASNEEGRAVFAPIREAPKPVVGGEVQPTPSTQQDFVNNDYMLMHPVYTQEYLASVKPTHKPRETVRDKVGYAAIQALRWGFDRACGYGPNMSERQWLRRMLFLETVAGVPGMVAGMLRHMRSLRSMRRDHGWIHTLLEEAENERMHLLTFLKLREPGPLFRSTVLLGQGVFFNAYTLAYILWPRCCHAFIGYLEEEAVRTYTHAVEEIDSGTSSISHWATTPAPDIAVSYWRLEPGATLRDVVLNVRADEAAHSFVNHTFAALGKDAENPFSKGSLHVP
ncbi:hypothetical protein N2152v2_010704 [Parachlorella kessleri]